MKVAPLIGLLGVLVAVMSVQLNDVLTTTAIADIGGEVGIDSDVSVWLPTLYVVGEVTGMAIAPTLGVIFTIRRFALFVILLSPVPTLIIPFCHGPEPLLGMRLLQGFAGGLTIPLLMTVALRVLAPPIRLYGLAAYALSATFAPNLANSLAGLWVDQVGDFRFIFFQAIPFAAVAAVLVWWGADQDQPKYEMLKKFDWPGMLLVAVGFGSLAVVLEQGDRLDWFNSPVISVLTLLSALAIPLLIVRELTAPQPLFLLALLKRRNFAYGIVALILFLVVSTSSSGIPVAFLEQVRGYRSLQAQFLTLEVAMTQLIFLPLAAVLLNLKHVDARWIGFVGFASILIACIGAARLDSSWSRDQFYLWQLLQSFGSAFVVMSLLMIATNAIRDPKEGPFAAGLVNAPRAVAEAIGVWVTELITRWRGGMHRGRIVDLIGQQRLSLIQAAPLPGGQPPPLMPNGAPSSPGALETLGNVVNAQVTTLVTSDTYLVMGALVVVLILVLAILPVRTYPPRIVMAQH